MLSLANGDNELVPITHHGDVFLGHADGEAEEENKVGGVVEGMGSVADPVADPVGRDWTFDNC